MVRYHYADERRRHPQMPIDSQPFRAPPEASEGSLRFTRDCFEISLLPPKESRWVSIGVPSGFAPPALAGRP